jgi:hypothetical protein
MIHRRAEITVATTGRGTYDITHEVQRHATVRDGLATVFIQHTSASLIICENADPDVRRDLEAFFARLVPDGDPLFIHTAEGDDARSSPRPRSASRSSAASSASARGRGSTSTSIAARRTGDASSSRSSVSELGDEIRTVLSRSDRGLRRFGAAAHRYELLPVAALALPEELRTFAAEVGAGGAGPGYGIVPLDRIAPVDGLWPVAHLGCGYVAAVHERGEVVMIAPTATARLATGFLAWYAAWIERLGRGAPIDPVVAPGTCALASALSAYLAMAEERLGGPLSDDQLRDTLGGLGPGAIAIAAEAGNLLFDAGDPVDPCVACAVLVGNLVDQGLRSDVVAPGLPPRVVRPVL